MTNVLIGADPELWIVDSSGDFIPASDLIPGDKKNPFKLDKGAVQVDGLAVEFNIDPVDNAQDFNKNIETVLNQIEEMVKSADKDLSFLFTPVAKFRKIIWDMTPDKNKVLGCDPDYNYKGQVNVNPSNKLFSQNLRTAAGHMHIGFTEKEVIDQDHFDFCRDIADHFFHSHLSCYVPETPEEEQRMMYYGHNGSWRPKKYGIELRAPSNLPFRTKESRELIFNQTRETFREYAGI